MQQSTPKLEATTNSPANLNLPQLSKISYGDNFGNYLSTEKHDFKSSVSSEIYQRRASLRSPKINESELIKIINEHHNKYLPEATDEVIEYINKMKDYKWKLGVILNDKINYLNQKIKEEKDRFAKKQKEISETKVYENKIEHLKKLIKKEEEEGFSQENTRNQDLQKKKKALLDQINYIEQKKKKSLLDQINYIEQKKKNLKENMMEKYRTMIDLKQKLANSISELMLIKEQILSRKFAFDQEEMKKKPVEKKDPEEENLLHLSQNIGEFINKKLLIKEDNY